MGQTEALDRRIGIGQRTQQQCKERIDHQKAQDCQQQPDPRASHDTPANILNAAARVPGAPAHLSLQSAFPSLADRAFLLLRSPWMPSVGDHATAGKVAESRGVRQRRHQWQGLRHYDGLPRENIALLASKCGCGIAQCEACCAHLPSISAVRGSGIRRRFPIDRARLIRGDRYSPLTRCCDSRVTGHFERVTSENVERSKKARWLTEIPTHCGRMPFTLSL